MSPGNAASFLFWATLLAVLWMFAGHAWAGTLLGVLVAGWIVFAIINLLRWL